MIAEIIQSAKTQNSCEKKEYIKNIDLIVDYISSNNISNDILDMIYGIFECNPLEDCDVLWSLMHTIERIPNSERLLIKSLTRRRSIFGIRMLGRCINANINDIDGNNLLKYLRSILEDVNVEKEIKTEGLRYLRVS